MAEGVTVVAGWRPWSGDHQVAPEDSIAVVITHFEINGYWVWSDDARLHNDGPFLCISIRKQSRDDASLRGRQQLKGLLASFEEGSWVDQDDAWITYLVGTVDLRMLEPSEPALAAVP